MLDSCDACEGTSPGACGPGWPPPSSPLECSPLPGLPPGTGLIRAQPLDWSPTASSLAAFLPPDSFILLLVWLWLPQDALADPHAQAAGASLALSQLSAPHFLSSTPSPPWAACVRTFPCPAMSSERAGPRSVSSTHVCEHSEPLREKMTGEQASYPFSVKISINMNINSYLHPP